MIPALISVMLLVSDTAAETAAPTAPASAEAAEVPKAERQICKREPIAGSQYGSKRVCMTAAQWKARKRNGNAGLEDLDTRTRANPQGL